MTEIQAVCGVISTLCTLVWIVNQIFWYKIFKRHFDRQEEVMHYQVELNDLHKTLLNAQLVEYERRGLNKLPPTCHEDGVR